MICPKCQRPELLPLTEAFVWNPGGIEIPPWVEILIYGPHSLHCLECDYDEQNIPEELLLRESLQRTLSRLAEPPPGFLYYVSCSYEKSSWELEVKTVLPERLEPCLEMTKALLEFAIEKAAPKLGYTVTPEVFLLRRIATYQEFLRLNTPKLLLDKQKRLVLTALEACMGDTSALKKEKDS